MGIKIVNRANNCDSKNILYEQPEESEIGLF